MRKLWTGLLSCLFPDWYSPWRACAYCGRRKAKEQMIYSLPEWFCSQECADAGWIEWQW